MALTLLHTADLHLDRNDRAYSLAVLDELVSLAQARQPALWVLCGDVFNTYPDAQALAEPVAERLRPVAEQMPVLVIPGNHEALQAPKSGAALPDLGAVRWLQARPFEHVAPPELPVDLVAVPFQRDLSGYPDWAVPPKERHWRVGLLHGVVTGMTYTGESEEEEHAVIDPDLLHRLALDVAALGHIHAAREAWLGPCLAHYPGSARVWRKGEAGVRCATLIHLPDEGRAHLERVPLRTAGCYREVTVPVDEAGTLAGEATPQALVERLLGEGAAADWVQVQLTGVVAATEAVAPLARELESRGGAAFRRLVVVTDRLVVAEQLRHHPLRQAFDALWHQHRHQATLAGDERETALLDRARRLALEQLAARTQADV